MSVFWGWKLCFFCFVEKAAIPRLTWLGLESKMGQFRKLVTLNLCLGETHSGYWWSPSKTFILMHTNTANWLEICPKHLCEMVWRGILQIYVALFIRIQLKLQSKLLSLAKQQNNWTWLRALWSPCCADKWTCPSVTGSAAMPFIALSGHQQEGICQESWTLTTCHNQECRNYLGN